MDRRSFLQLLCAIAASSTISTNFAFAADAAIAVEQVHQELWRRFIDRHGVMIDFTDLDGTVNYPTPEECRDGKPNALGWFQPIENGAMFNGLYMDAAINRWTHTQTQQDADRARKLMEGLLFLNSVSDVKGFVARGVSTDGKSHYAMGSNDQTTPWYTGLWLYWKSDLATPEEKAKIAKHLVETTEEIIKRGWKMPAEPPFNTRGTYEGFHFEEVARKLFTLQLMFVITGDDKWRQLYLAELQKRGGESNRTKLETCQAGMAFFYAKTHNWTSCTAVGALRGLWELETDPTLKTAYAQGLAASAKLAAESLPLAMQFDPKKHSEFSQDWRQAMMPLWKPQTTEQEAAELAGQQIREFGKISPRRNQEAAFIREPVAAAWIVTLCPDPEVVKPHAAEIERIIARFDYSQLYYCTFFWAESAWWRLQDLK